MASRYRKAMVAFLLAVTTPTRSANADESRVEATPATLAIRSPRGAALEERREGEETWRLLCRLPCETPVDPSAAHRLIIDGEGAVPILTMLRSEGKTELDVTPSRSEARTGLMLFGGVVGVAGLVIAAVSVIKLVGQVGNGPSNSCVDGPPGCSERNREATDDFNSAQSSRLVFTLVGVGMAAVGTLIAVAAAKGLSGRTEIRPHDATKDARRTFLPRDPMISARPPVVFAVPLLQVSF